jgi:hypothetical protein
MKERPLRIFGSMHLRATTTSKREITSKRGITFPHQTTADQFFDESQFESYRRLGMHIRELCLGENIATLPPLAPE